MVKSKNTKAYYRELKRHLVGTPAYKQRVIDNVESDIEAFRAEHPSAAEQELVQYLGDPADYAQEYAATMPQQELVRMTRFQRRVLTAVVVSLVVALVVWVSAVAYTVIDIKKTNDGYTTTEVWQRVYQEIE